MTRPDMDPRRLAVTKEAREWLGTPYHHMGRLRGAGTDCLMVLAEVYEAAAIVPHVEVPFYPPDWHLHRDAERYLEGMMRYAREIPGRRNQVMLRSSNSAVASLMARSSLSGPA